MVTRIARIFSSSLVAVLVAAHDHSKNAVPVTPADK
ncbi:hypothetical protein GGR01_000450 [Acetobacter oeni]|nr:hypothetical protein [Acetobacter oeni]